MGLVFVLIPGGTFRMGAVKPDEDSADGAERRPRSARRRISVTEVPLDPFFLSKYEMTQGQWLQARREEPEPVRPGTNFGGKVVDLRNPVEQVSWEDCDLWLGRLGLMLPTEAQWEYAARGGTTTPWWTGIGTDGLAKAANLADAFCQSERRTSELEVRVVERRLHGARARRIVRGESVRSARRARQRLGVVPRLVWRLRRDSRAQVTACEVRRPLAPACTVAAASSDDASFARSACRGSHTPGVPQQLPRRPSCQVVSSRLSDFTPLRPITFFRGRDLFP